MPATRIAGIAESRYLPLENRRNQRSYRSHSPQKHGPPRESSVGPFHQPPRGGRMSPIDVYFADSVFGVLLDPPKAAPKLAEVKAECTPRIESPGCPTHSSVGPVVTSKRSEGRISPPGYKPRLVERGRSRFGETTGGLALPAGRSG